MSKFKTFKYKTNKENFDQTIFPYLRGLSKNIIEEEKYNSIIGIESDGIIYIVSSPIGIKNKTGELIQIITEDCSNKINNKLKDLLS